MGRMNEEQSNPFQIALFWVAAVALVVGLILLGVGNSMEHDYMSETDGTGQMLWGGALSGVGVSGLLLWLTASAIIWKPARAQSYAGVAAEAAAAKTVTDEG